MNTTLCFDFGNTRLKCGVFSDGRLEKVFELPDDHPETILGILGQYRPERSILSSVIHHDSALESLLMKHTRFHKLSIQTRLPFVTPVGKPETIGADRLALAAAAVHFYKGRNNLVIGLGSCITFNFINKYDSFIGGSISPGKEMRLKALNAYTANLPLVAAEDLASLWDVPLMGTDTKSNILSGVLLGIASEIDGIIGRYEKKFRNFNVLLTGGDAAYFARLLTRSVFCDPDLLFKGLYAICDANATSFNFGDHKDEINESP